jgi:hypothetical protein
MILLLVRVEAIVCFFVEVAPVKSAGQLGFLDLPLLSLGDVKIINRLVLNNFFFLKLS